MSESITVTDTSTWTLPSARLVNSMVDTDDFTDDVLIAPESDRFNDFGYRVRADIGIRLPGGSREWLSAYFAFKGKSDTRVYVEELLAGSTQGMLLRDVAIPFASLLSESKSYGRLRSDIGTVEGFRRLREINDISILISEDKLVPDWDDFFSSDVFTHAMTRSSESYFSYRRGAQFLEGRQELEVDARQRLSVELNGKGPTVTLDFKFDDKKILRGRIAVLIGKNGVGKTSTLARLAAGLAIHGRRGVHFTARPEINQVLAFAHSGAVSLFKQRKDRAGATSVRAFAFDPYSASRPSVRDKQTRLLVDIARASDFKEPLLDEFRKIVREEFSGLRLFLPILEVADKRISPTYRDAKSMPYIQLRNWPRDSEGLRLSAFAAVDHSRDLVFLDSENEPRELSLGQAAFLNFTLTALANAGPASVLLIDEPENFLHPNLISRFMRVLHKVLESTKSIGIIATHSPFVVREVQSVQVHVLGQHREGAPTQIGQPRLQTLGANVAAIADEVFQDDLPEHLFELLLQQANLDSRPFSEVLQLYAEELSIEALMLLRQRAERSSQVSN